MDADGRLVFIESLEGMDNRGGFNCSGFAKWVVDGLYEPLTGTYLPVEPLRRKHLDYRGTRWSRRLEDTRDPYFGLDWTRNLALHLHAAQIGHNPVDLDPESRDVRAVAVARYREDVGYPLADLPSVLYWLAAIDPGTIYLGSVNRPLGDEVVIRQHSHVVVFFPFFDQNGRFRSVVMERNVETDVASLQRRYEDGFVHLVRLETGAEFRIPQFVDADEPLLLR